MRIDLMLVLASSITLHASVSCGIYPPPVGTGSITGMVRTMAAQELAGVAVRLTLHDWGGTPLCWWRDAVTDSNGRYVLSDLPTGRPLSVGAQVDAAPVATFPYRGVFFPSATTRDKAELLILAEKEHRSGVDFVLPGPLPLREIVLEVMGPDGSILPGEAVRAYDEAGRNAGSARADARGRVVFRLCQGTSYVFYAQWFGPEPDMVLHSEPTSVPGDIADHRLGLVLSSPGFFIDHHRGPFSLTPNPAPSHFPKLPSSQVP